MGGRPIGLASFGNGGVMVVCEDGAAWYMGAPHGVWFRQMRVPFVEPDPPPQAAAPEAAQQASPQASREASPPAGSAPGEWTNQPPFPIPDDIPDHLLPPGVKR